MFNICHDITNVAYICEMYNIGISVIQALGEQLKVRQQVIATATVYFRRFYARLVNCYTPAINTQQIM